MDPEHTMVEEDGFWSQSNATLTIKEFYESFKNELSDGDL